MKLADLPLGDCQYANMRLLHVIRSVNPVSGGPAEGVRQLIAASTMLGQRPSVLTLDAPDDAWLRDFPGEITAIGPVALNYGYTDKLVPWLRCNHHRYDAVVVHGLWQQHGLAVWRALSGGPVPYFVYPHGMLDPWFKREYPFKHLKKLLYWLLVESKVVRDAAAVLFTASEESRLAAQTFRPYGAKPAVVGYGIELADASRLGSAEAFHQSWPETRGKRNLLFLGRLHEKKGGDLLIEAFAQVGGQDPDLHLVMAGPDDGSGIRAGLGALAQRLGIADRITWTGMLGGEAKWSALHAAEVFALPSHQENFGIAVVEALAVGVPVLISEKVNIWREIVQEGGGFADADTLQGTAACLRRWLALRPEERTAMGRQAARCFQRNYQMTAAARRLVDVIGLHLKTVRPAVGMLDLDSQC